MAVQVSYPGVYIEEFAPGAPIEGVLSSALGVIGTAQQGPIKVVTLIESWDDFVRQFGDIPTDSVNAGYLAHGVYGFFQNGGTQAWVVRAATGVQASAKLLNRAGGPNAAIIATANAEGVAGNSITVTVTDSSVLATSLAAAMAGRSASLNAGHTIATIAAGTQGISVGDAVQLVQAGAPHKTRVASLTAPNKITLAVAAPAGPNTGWTVTFAPFLYAKQDSTKITAVADNGNGTCTLTVSSALSFPVGSRVTATDGAAANPVDVTVATVMPGNNLIVSAVLAATYVNGAIRLADWASGQKTLRLAVPTVFGLGTAFPRGTLVRVTPPAASGNPPHITTLESSGGDTITLAAPLPATFALGDLTDLPFVESLEFDIKVNDPALAQAEDPATGLSMHPDHPRYWKAAFSSQSITLSDDPANPPPTSDDNRPAGNPTTTYPLVGGQPDNRANAWADVTGNPAGYLDLLKPIDEVALVAIPGATDPVVQKAMIDHCETMYDRFAILDSVLGSDDQQIRTQFASVRSQLGFAALYYPWIQVRNPATHRDELWPPSGHLAGVYARTDATRGIHKAPANTNVRGAFGVERRLTDSQQGPLNLMGINVIRVFPEQSDPMVWGARTTATDRNWQYVNIRRLFLFLEESIEQGIRWAVFEPNNLQLWQKLKRTISAFLTQVWRDGALFGETADKAFYVRIDEKLNPFSTQALGRLYIEIGVRPTYPAEFIIVRIGIWDGGANVSES